MNKKKYILILTIIILCLSLLGSFLYYQYLKKESYDNAYNNLNLELKSKENLIKEIGDDYLSFKDDALIFEYSDRQIDVKTFIDKRNGNIKNVEPRILYLNEIGKQEIKYTIETSDKYKQNIQKTFSFNIEIIDTKAPIIELTRAWKRYRADEDIDLTSFIKVIEDEVDGSLEYAKELKDGSYTIDETYFIKEANGDYFFLITARDKNGNESYSGFMITIKNGRELTTEEKAFLATANDNILNKEEALEEKEEFEKEETLKAQKEEEARKERLEQAEKQKEEIENTIRLEAERKAKEEAIIEAQKEAQETKELAGEWEGPKLNKVIGVVEGPSGKETYYNLPMQGVINVMRRLGYSEEEYPYWIREDGCKMLGDYIMIAADYSIRPRGTLLPTSLGMGIVCDTGAFVSENQYQIDIAVDWR